MTSIPGYKTTYQIIKPGTGDGIKARDKVTVHATGVVKENSYKFWSTKDPGK